MKIVRVFVLVISLSALLQLSAVAGVSVNSPAMNEELASPFNLSALSATCSSQHVDSMGYSLDSSTDTIIVKGDSLDTSVKGSPGAHTLHAKAWGEHGSVCVTDVAISVITDKVAVPSNAIRASNLQALGNWRAINDTATGDDSASGLMTMVSSPSLSGSAREFVTAYNRYSGERYDVSFGDDILSTHFFYDAWLYLKSPSTSIANVEMDMNQVMENGQTVIFGVQCDGWSGTWDYTANTGTPEKPVDKWLHSKSPCNPRNWRTNAWHHVQIDYMRDNSGKVTYESVWLDGAKSSINVTVPSAFALNWSPTLLTNFQVDSDAAGSASSTVYLADLTIYRW